MRALPEFFVARGKGRADILIFSVALAPSPALALAALLERVSRLAWGARGAARLRHQETRAARR